jgi:uncharacterized membrane protein
MSYLLELCLFEHSGVQCIYILYIYIYICVCVFLHCFSSFCVPYVASFSGLSILDCPFGIL